MPAITDKKSGTSSLIKNPMTQKKVGAPNAR
jgi:hypothetical protein